MKFPLKYIVLFDLDTFTIFACLCNLTLCMVAHTNSYKAKLRLGSFMKGYYSVVVYFWVYRKLSELDRFWRTVCDAFEPWNIPNLKPDGKITRAQLHTGRNNWTWKNRENKTSDKNDVNFIVLISSYIQNTELKWRDRSSMGLELTDNENQCNKSVPYKNCML